jgi:pyruvate/2-oxoglutarate/acetoin dehydrogenase E1 component/TPP-dependent pyruvate/acetoin dehydrogenase alpha subunit
MSQGNARTIEYPQEDTILTPEEILNDFRICVRSRHASLVGRREVMSGKAKFGIFGDGKEIVQAAMARVFQPGDFRSGYYRDQTLMFALGELTVQQYFAQLYADTEPGADPASSGRLMNSHFATHFLNPDGSWRDLTNLYNSPADLSPTAAQMPRLVGLAAASILYRELPGLQSFSQFSQSGNEVAFGTIGNAATSEGMFWEAINAIGVLQAPAVITIYDDEYGISVPNEFQMTKGDLSELLRGFQRTEIYDCKGFDLYTLPGWDYPELIAAYRQAALRARSEHVPSLLHIIELTQPQGHSTSGSQERYKPKERLEWEQECDALKVFRQWILKQGLASETELAELEQQERAFVESERKQAWEAYQQPLLKDRLEVLKILQETAQQAKNSAPIEAERQKLAAIPNPLRRDMHEAVHNTLLLTLRESANTRAPLVAWKRKIDEAAYPRFSSHLYDESSRSAIHIPAQPPIYAENSPTLMGHEILNAAFDAAFAREPRLVAFGEDIGRLGDVNQGFRGLQAKYGPLRISDTGIRETTILGQAIGYALRGLHPIAEIQYLDYVLYALQIISDDLASLHWRTKGAQRAPVIIRTRGHRLEGVWHSGSPMAGILNLARGIHLLVPRNMTQAAGFYNTLLLAEEPALVVEVLNGYRLKEKLPQNIAAMTVPLGQPEILRPGQDVTLVTYGACCRVCLEAAEKLSLVDIEVEVIDVQSLLPFDLDGRISLSLQKTGRIVLVDEDVPGGATAYMLQEILEKQKGYHWLDSPPCTITGKSHRPAYGSDGDYWSKPNPQQIFEDIYALMHEADPQKYPGFMEES